MGRKMHQLFACKPEFWVPRTSLQSFRRKVPSVNHPSHPRMSICEVSQYSREFSNDFEIGFYLHHLQFYSPPILGIFNYGRSVFNVPSKLAKILRNEPSLLFIEN